MKEAKNDTNAPLRLYDVLTNLLFIALTVLTLLGFMPQFDIDSILNNILSRNLLFLFTNVFNFYVLSSTLGMRMGDRSRTKNKRATLFAEFGSKSVSFLMIVLGILYFIYSMLMLVTFNGLNGPGIVLILLGSAIGTLIGFESADEDIIRQLLLIDAIRILFMAVLIIVYISLFFVIKEFDILTAAGLLILFIAHIFRARILKYFSRSSKYNAITHAIVDNTFPALSFYFMNFWCESAIYNLVDNNINGDKLVILLLSGIIPIRLFTILFPKANIPYKIVSLCILSAFIFIDYFQIHIMSL